MLSNHLVEPLRRQDSTEQAVGSFGGGFVRRLAPSNHFADGFQARPLMLFLWTARRILNQRASCKIVSSGIGFGCAVDFAGFGRQEIAAPSIGGRGKDNARCFWARRDCAG